jgi:hypothetical protein
MRCRGAWSGGDERREHQRTVIKLSSNVSFEKTGCRHCDNERIDARDDIQRSIKRRGGLRVDMNWIFLFLQYSRGGPNSEEETRQCDRISQPFPSSRPPTHETQLLTPHSLFCVFLGFFRFVHTHSFPFTLLSFPFFPFINHVAHFQQPQETSSSCPVRREAR